MTGKTGTDAAGFVKAVGTRLEVDGRPYYFVGTNLWYACYLGSRGRGGDRDRLERELDHLKALGISNLRVLGASEESGLGNSIRPAMQKAPGVYDEDLLDGLDFLLGEMGRRGMYAVVYLNNFWEWSGGMSQYVNWFGGGDLADPAGGDAGWDDFINYSATFYSNEKAQEAYRRHIELIVNRRNPYTGLQYRDDPAVMAWQLANEPRPGRGEAGRKNLDAFYGWIDETAAYIHSLDANHLVTTGSEGTIGCAQSAEAFLKAHRSEHVDYASLHLWPKNWGWFDSSRIEETYPRSERNALAYFDEHMELARELGKPITMEEFGMERDDGAVTEGTPTSARDRFFTRMFAAVRESAAAGAPVAGTNFWAWAGEGRPAGPDGAWRPGDERVGDPPSEPQGHNSVFDTDEGTLAIIAEHARDMGSLRG